MRYPKYISIDFGEKELNWYAKLKGKEYIQETINLDTEGYFLTSHESYCLEDLKDSNPIWRKITKEEYEDVIKEKYINESKDDIKTLQNKINELQLKLEKINKDIETKQFVNIFK